MPTKKKVQPTESWIKKMIKDEEEGIKKYSNRVGYSKQAAQERSHLKKLKAQLKKVKR